MDNSYIIIYIAWSGFMEEYETFDKAWEAILKRLGKVDCQINMIKKDFDRDGHVSVLGVDGEDEPGHHEIVIMTKEVADRYAYNKGLYMNLNELAE